MSALSDARAGLVALFRYGDDPNRPIIEELTTAYDHEPKPGDGVPPYLAIWQNGAAADNQFFMFQVRVYVDMAVSARDGQRLFDELCLRVERSFVQSAEFVTTGWQTEWSGEYLLGIWDVLIGRSDVS